MMNDELKYQTKFLLTALSICLAAAVIELNFSAATAWLMCILLCDKKAFSDAFEL
jgi:hypothetical protein